MLHLWREIQCGVRAIVEPAHSRKRHAVAELAILHECQVLLRDKWRRMHIAFNEASQISHRAAFAVLHSVTLK